MQSGDFSVRTVQTQPIAGQNTGTSGLRKTVRTFRSENYLANWIQSLFNTMRDNGTLEGAKLAIGGDGRFWNNEALQIIFKIAAANHVNHVFVGQHGILSTPAVSAIIRKRQLTGGIILTASHNPGGEDGDFGIKYNTSNGGPAPEKVTDGIYKHTLNISEYKIADLPDLDLSEVGKKYTWNNFTVEVIDSVEDYLELMSRVFDLNQIRAFLASHPQFKVKIDSLNGVTGVYVRRIFHEVLGIPEDSLQNVVPKVDFGGKHPDPNLTYAAELVEQMYSGDYEFGAAFDGDGDRNMVLGNRFFVNPSDSVAIIAANADAIPYFSEGLNAVARSMPTSSALDRVAAAKNVRLYEVPTGWKFFGNVMDHYGKGVICGEESFGTGSDHIREKDGVWAVLAWLAMLAHRNASGGDGGKAVGVEDIVREHWKAYGRNFFSRYDYEQVGADDAKAMMAHLAELQKNAAESADVRASLESDEYKLDFCDDFEYTDPFDGSVSARQGLRFCYKDGSRIIFRLSGTGSSGATIRMYVEKFEGDEAKHSLEPKDSLRTLIQLALSFSKLATFTGRQEPTVIT